MQAGARLAAILLFALYPFGVWAALHYLGGMAASLAILLLLAVLLPARLYFGGPGGGLQIWGIGIAMAVLVALSLLFENHRPLFALPVLINLFLLIGFGSSLLKNRVPVVETFARMIDGNLSTAQQQYCRSVTKVWCLFFLVNGSICVWLALFAPAAVWTLYTGGIAYVLMGALFAGEFIVRKIRFP